MSWTNILKSLVLVPLSLVLALAFAEIFLRALGIGYGYSPLEAANLPRR